MEVWLASLVLYSTVYGLCELARHVVGKRLVRVPDKYVPLVMEFIGVVQVCTPIFDVNTVMGQYGLQGVVVEITFIELANLILLRDAVADPCPLIMGFLKKTVTAQKLALFIGVQFVGAYFSYLLVLCFWKLGIHPKHTELLHENCESDLTVTMIFGSLVEAAGLIVMKVSEHFLEGHIKAQRVFEFASALVAGVVTIIGIHLTGMYANPIVAWACTFNCGEVPYLTHFVVYWLAPLAAHFALDKWHHQIHTAAADVSHAVKDQVKNVAQKVEEVAGNAAKKAQKVD